ncbi:XXYS1_4_G0029300.mRNA.1.CDS.1 [Saccharomyces cerevisiae]|nr:XXYS1_4_G0029300.mRNA.1.CDS.1 [Saccharomyces cerevisiae]
MIIIFIELCRIADSLLWIPKSSRRTSSIFCIPNIIAFINNGIPTIISKFTSRNKGYTFTILSCRNVISHLRFVVEKYNKKRITRKKKLWGH